MRRNWRKWLIVGAVALVALIGLGVWFSTTTLYTWAARKTVVGEVVSIADLTSGAVLGTRPGMPGGGITYSFAIAIKADDGTIYSASSEDRQWAAVKQGYRVRATLFPYSPLNWQKQGTYHGARVRQIISVPSTSGGGSTAGGSGQQPVTGGQPPTESRPLPPGSGP
jgi:hypothetical protein